ncbi:agamous-like MADS-box protein AGL104 [Capsella rubella]|uniref:agamous-like MADS-box protein AGL104 n=1 Tax=Capsella rubella TaxID=81985 RepID=UPI000CD56327|nr:agamous-like MADS-box protein AGL104 [Capsella rubella]
MVKVKLAWVENNKARAIFFRRRSEGVLKKVKELTILCDILACLIIFSPNDAEPMVWPSVETARGLLDNFFSLPKDRIILGREMLGSMQFSPLRDPPVLPFEVQVEQLAEKRDEATVLIELANNDVRQEPPPNETFAREDHVDLSLLGIDKDWLKLNNYHF